MGFAVTAWIICAGLVFVSVRSLRKQPSANELERATAGLQGPPPGQDVSNETAARVQTLVAELEQAASQLEAVAVLNEFISEVELESMRGAAVPATLARACFSVGVMLGVLALADLLGDADAIDWAIAMPALLAGAAGVLGGMLCYQIDRGANRRRHAYREAVRRLSRALQLRFPLLRAEVSDT